MSDTAQMILTSCMVLCIGFAAYWVTKDKASTVFWNMALALILGVMLF